MHFLPKCPSSQNSPTDCFENSALLGVNAKVFLRRHDGDSLKGLGFAVTGSAFGNRKLLKKFDQNFNKLRIANNSGDFQAIIRR